MSNHTIVIDKISKSFGRRSVLHEISYTFESGRIYILKGPSGSGKTTLLNIMSGLMAPTSGTITTSFGKPTDRDWFRHKASYVFQNYALIDNDTVKKNLILATRFKKEHRNIESFTDALAQVGMHDVLDQKVFELSGGEQQRVSISRLYLRDFEVVFADEPTGNLDTGNTEVIMDLFTRLADMGKIVIITSHNERLLEIADEVISLEMTL